MLFAKIIFWVIPRNQFLTFIFYFFFLPECHSSLPQGSAHCPLQYPSVAQSWGGHVCHSLPLHVQCTFNNIIYLFIFLFLIDERSDEEKKQEWDFLFLFLLIRARDGRIVFACILEQTFFAERSVVDVTLINETHIFIIHTNTNCTSKL